MLNNRFIMKESTEKVVREILKEDIDTLSDDEIAQKLRESKKVVVQIDESGNYVVKQVLFFYFLLKERD